MLDAFAFIGELVKDIVNGVLITALIFIISTFIPIVGFLCALFIPLPIFTIVQSI